MRKLFIIVPLMGLLVAAVWFAVYSWNALQGPDIPPGGYFAMWLGIVFSLFVGCGLMALVFYSSRHGYDAPAEYERRDHRPKA